MPSVSLSNTIYQRLGQLRPQRGDSFSEVVGSMLDELIGKRYDVVHTKDTGLVGALGESIAWQYLFERGIVAFELGAGRPSFKPLDTLIHLEDGLTEEQLSFLGHAREHLSWDFVGYSRQDLARYSMGPRGTRACLIEVKTSRPGKRVDGFRPKDRTGMAPEDLRAASRLGFTMLLVTVELTDDWQAIVTDQEILAD